MTSLSKTISHGYDPSIVYHSHSANMPHLANWISELVALTESSYPKNPTPSTDDLVHALQRYDAVFRELFRQTSIFSEPVTKMLAQAWAGVIKLLDYMIKSYHRYVKHTSHLQTQAHNLLNDRQRSEAAHKIQKEESDLERTSLRARIRSLESELESMKLMRAGMEEENHKMRRIISVYIQSSDLNDPAWDVMDEDDMGGVDTLKRGLQKKYANQDAVLADQQEFGFKRRDVIDAGHAQLKTLNRLDIELNEILANVLKEENRQRLLMQSLLKLIDKNKDQFFSAEEITDAEEADWIGIMSANRKDKDYAMSPVAQHSPSFSRQMSGRSLSMKLSRQGSAGPGGIAGMNSTANSSTATLGEVVNVPVSRPLLRASLSAKVPSQLSVNTNVNNNSTGGLLSPEQLTAREIAAINTTASSYGAFQNSHHNTHHNTHNNSGANTANSAGHGANTPATTKTSRMNRSQSMLALTTGFAILGSDLNKKCDVGVQVDEKDEFGCVDEEPSHLNLEETMSLGVAPLPPVCIHIKGKEFPFLIRRRMHTYPKLLRVPPVVWTCTMIMNIYLDKIQMDEERASMGLRKQTLPDHVYDYFLRTTGLKSAADVHVAQLLKACDAHNRRQPRIALFASQLGLTSPEEAPPLDVRDSDFVLHVLSCLLRQGELMPDMFKSLKTKSAVIKSSVLLRPDVLRISATHLVQDTFAKLLPDGGDDFVMKVKSMQSTDKGFRYVDVDNLVDLLMDPWHTVRLNFEDHARFIFREFCGVHRVLQEATFANDEGVECTDTVLMEIKRSVATDCLRRPLRLFQRIEDKGTAKHDEDRNSALNNPNNPNNPNNAATNTNKEPVCEAMNKKQFMECLHQINPAITTQEALDLFQEGLDIAHENVLRCLELMWMRFLDDASHYNHITVGGAVSTSDNKGSSSHSNNNNSKASAQPSSPTNGGGQRHGQQVHGHKHLGTNRDYWVNMRTQVSQWTRPYLQKAFRAQDLEIETFVAVLVRNDVLVKSPLLENIVNLPPRDLWPNAETFLKQIRDKARRGGKEIAPTPSSNASGSGHPAAGRIGGVSFSSDRPSSSGSTSTAGNPRTHLLLRVPATGEDSDDLGSDHSPKPRSPGGKKFFGTGHSTPAAGNHHHNSSGNAGFHAHEGMVKKGTAHTGLAHTNTALSTSAHGASASAGTSGVPPSGKGHKDRKKSAASVSATPAAGVVSAPVPSMVKPSSAKRTTSGSS